MQIAISEGGRNGMKVMGRSAEIREAEAGTGMIILTWSSCIRQDF